MNDGEDIHAGFANPGQVEITLEDAPDGTPSVKMHFLEMQAWVQMIFPEQVDQIADALHEAAEGLRVEIRRRQYPAN